MNENLFLGILMFCSFVLGVVTCLYIKMEKKPEPRVSTSISMPPVYNINNDYHIFKGFIPSDIGNKDKRSFKWDHEPTLQAKGVEAFIWCDGVWGSIVLEDFKITSDVTFVRAPLCTTYIKKSESNAFLNSEDRSFEMLGFEKNTP